MGIAVSPQIHPQVAEFIDKPRKMLINGRWVNAASGKTFLTYTILGASAEDSIPRYPCGTCRIKFFEVSVSLPL